MNEIKKNKQLNLSSPASKSKKQPTNEPKDSEPQEEDQSQQQQHQQQQQLDDSANNTNDANNRRLSYKEDDLLRKQRLKENLNQLLIEYKHEEEAQLKKSSRFSMSNSSNTTATIIPKLNNRISLDSCYPNTNKKASAFSLVVPPQQQKQQVPNLNSAFRPVNAGSVASASSSKATNSENRTQSVDLIKKGCSSASSSEASSWSSSSSTSSSSSSNSPPKTRQSNLISVMTSNISGEPTGATIYKKPCLISPRKQQLQHDLSNKLDDSYASLLAGSSAMMLGSPNSISKSLTIKVRNDSNNDLDAQKESHTLNEIIDLTKTCSSRMSQEQQQKQQPQHSHKKQSTLNSGSINLSGYLWKTRDNYTSLNSFKSNASATSGENQQFERYWFSLNASLCCLIYWNDKHEQDLGRFPVVCYY